MSTTPYNATGRRKEAIAHAWLTPAEEGKSGKITINRRSFEEYLPTDALQNAVLQPFYATNTLKKFDVRVVCRGGGVHGQTGAISLAIARSLVMIDEEYRAALREQGLLTRDSPHEGTQEGWSSRCPQAFPVQQALKLLSTSFWFSKSAFPGLGKALFLCPSAARISSGGAGYRLAAGKISSAKRISFSCRA